MITMYVVQGRHPPILAGEKNLPGITCRGLPGVAGGNYVCVKVKDLHTHSDIVISHFYCYWIFAGDAGGYSWRKLPAASRDSALGEAGPSDAADVSVQFGSQLRCALRAAIATAKLHYVFYQTKLR